jgi:hypothetical protein
MQQKSETELHFCMCLWPTSLKTRSSTCFATITKRHRVWYLILLLSIYVHAALISSVPISKHGHVTATNSFQVAVQCWLGRWRRLVIPQVGSIAAILQL